MRRGLIGMSLLLAVACEAVPVEPTIAWTPPPSPQIADTVLTPTWAERAPTAADVMKVYPMRALSEAIEGIAYLNCTVKETRALDCVEGTETPVGYGFSSAALQISRLFVVREDYPGVTPGMAVRLPVRFKVE
jgi:hypothetical protein